MKGLDVFIERLIQEWNVPGIAVGVVKDGEVIFEQGFGYRKVDNKLNVTADTVFSIASCTKSFTATALAMLVDEGKLDWDKPIKEYIPWFILKDDYVTQKITARDFLTHRTGLARHDLLWFFNDFPSRKELVERLRYLDFNKDFRSSYQYNNLMYGTAGYLIEHISQLSWEDFVKEKILEPVEMSMTNLSYEEYSAVENRAFPYVKDRNGEMQEINYYNHRVPGGPVGGINSTIKDMNKWLAFNINQGCYNDKQIIDKSIINELYIPRIYIDQPIQYNEFSHNYYGMGWGIRPYRGFNRVCHYGGIDGFNSFTGFIPSEKIGVVILTNTMGINSLKLIDILSLNIFDKLLNLEEIDWNERFQDEIRRINNSPQGRETDIAHKETLHVINIDKYIGTYYNPGYGRFQIKKDMDNNLSIHWDRESFELKYLEVDVFEFIIKKWNWHIKVDFIFDDKDSVIKATMPLEPSVKEIAFDKIS